MGVGVRGSALVRMEVAVSLSGSMGVLVGVEYSAPPAKERPTARAERRPFSQSCIPNNLTHLSCLPRFVRTETPYLSGIHFIRSVRLPR